MENDCTAVEKSLAGSLSPWTQCKNGIIPLKKPSAENGLMLHFR